MAFAKLTVATHDVGKVVCNLAKGRIYNPRLMESACFGFSTLRECYLGYGFIRNGFHPGVNCIYRKEENS